MWTQKPSRRNPLKSGQCFLPGSTGSGEEWQDDYGMVAIPSSRVNVSYEVMKLKLQGLSFGQVAIPSSRVNVSYRQRNLWGRYRKFCVAIPSSRVNVSYLRIFDGYKMIYFDLKVAIPSSRVNVSYLMGQVALSQFQVFAVAIPSSRVNVSYSTHLFLRIIGNLTPLLREPHYFYAFFFPL